MRATFPFTIGAYLCVTIWVQRVAVVDSGALVRDLGGSVLAYTIVAALGWVIAARFTTDTARRAMVALLAGLWSVLYGSYFAFAAAAFGSDGGVLLVWTLLIGVLAAIVVLSKRTLDGVARALNAAGIALLVLAMIPLWRALPDREPQVAWTDARRDDRPDIYIIVPDKYSSPTWLARQYGVDHAPFEDSLKKLGFVIPRDARSNYAHTKLALPTFFEGQYVALPGQSTEGLKYDSLNTRIMRSPLWSDLRARGYRTAFFLSTFTGTRAVEGVDLALKAPQPSAARFAEAWHFHSPLVTISAIRCRLVTCTREQATPFPIEPLPVLEWKLQTLATLPDSAGPVAAVLHLMSPHEPFLFADDCSPREPWWPLAAEASESGDSLRAAYAAQVRCIDRFLLRTVTELVTRSGRPPVIIIQSDHGRGHVTRDVLRGFSLDLEEIAEEQLAERLSVFAAYRFPGADTLVYDGITPVNVLPMVKHAVFGEPFERRPDRTFWSRYQLAFDLTEIPATRLEAIARER